MLKVLSSVIALADIYGVVIRLEQSVGRTPPGIQFSGSQRAKTKFDVRAYHLRTYIRNIPEIAAYSCLAEAFGV